MMYNRKIKKKSWSNGEFSDIKSSNRKPINDFELFLIAIFFKVKVQPPSAGAWLNSNIDHP